MRRKRATRPSLQFPRPLYGGPIRLAAPAVTRDRRRRFDGRHDRIFGLMSLPRSVAHSASRLGCHGAATQGKDPKRSREQPRRQNFRLTSAVYRPPFASRTRPRCASVRHGKAAWLHSKLPRRSAPPIGEQRSRASPVRSSRRNIPSEPRFQGGGKSYGLCRATTRSIDLRASEVRACWAPACTAIQAKKIMLGVHDTVSPSKNP
jgi:hypothetical protein